MAARTRIPGRPTRRVGALAGVLPVALGILGGGGAADAASSAPAPADPPATPVTSLPPGISVPESRPGAGTREAPVATDATVRLSSPTVSFGDRILVTGDHWNPGSLVDITLCGNNGLRGTVDCDLAYTVQAGVNADGELSMSFAVAEMPPAPCPCVIRVTSPSAALPVDAPIDIIGAETAPLVEPPPDSGPPLEVELARLEGRAGVAEWFGAPPRRTLVFRVRNVSGRDLRDVRVSLTAGPGDDPTQEVAAPAWRALAPNASQTYRVPVEVDALTNGRVTVKGELSTVSHTVELRVSMTSRPWGLFVVGSLLALLLVARIVVRIRRRVRRRRVFEPTVARSAVVRPIDGLEIAAPDDDVTPSAEPTPAGTLETGEQAGGSDAEPELAPGP